MMDPTAFAKAVQPGMHGMIYEGLWRDLFVQPQHEHGRIVAYDPAAKTLTNQTTRTIKTTHWPEAAPVLVTISYADDASFFVDNEPASLEDVIDKNGSFVQVFPPRPQLVMVETDASQI